MLRRKQVFQRFAGLLNSRLYHCSMDPIAQHMPELVMLARAAGERIMSYFGNAEATAKQDKSPLTEADLAAHRLIDEALKKIAPSIPVVSEENAAHPDLEGKDRFWLVDPLDGTKSFVRGTGEFTVNIALVENRLPVLGVIGLPRSGAVYAGMAGEGAFREWREGKRESIRCRAVPKEGVSAVVSHAHRSAAEDEFLKRFRVTSRMNEASASKFCRVAEGAADIYPRMGPTMEWDTAAGHAIVEAAGGRVELPDGNPLLYGKAGFRNPHFVAYGWK